MSLPSPSAVPAPQPAATTIDELARATAHLAEYLGSDRSRLGSEAAVKTALVQPFIRALGYNVNDLSEVIPEFTADHGLKKGEKVDFALMRDDAVALLVECKCLESPLEVAHSGQLSRYFHNTEASFGLLTDGNRFLFFSDLEKQNVMDTRAFFEFRLDAHTRADVEELLRFGRNGFEVERNRASALRLKRLRLLGSEIARELDEPSEEIVTLLARRVREGKTTSAVRERFTPLVKQALEDEINRRVEKRLQSALAVLPANDEGDESSLSRTAETDTEDDGSASAEIATAHVIPEEAVESFRLVREICADRIDPERIRMKPGTQYVAFTLDGRSRKTLLRLRVRRQKLVAELFLPTETPRFTLTSPTEFTAHRDALLSALAHRLEG